MFLKFGTVGVGNVQTLNIGTEAKWPGRPIQSPGTRCWPTVPSDLPHKDNRHWPGCPGRSGSRRPTTRRQWSWWSCSDRQRCWRPPRSGMVRRWRTPSRTLRTWTESGSPQTATGTRGGGTRRQNRKRDEGTRRQNWKQDEGTEPDWTGRWMVDVCRYLCVWVPPVDHTVDVVVRVSGWGHTETQTIMKHLKKTTVSSWKQQHLDSDKHTTVKFHPDVIEKQHFEKMDKRKF